MKAAEISEGKLYRAKVNGKLTTVRVDRITEVTKGISRNTYKHYHVTNMETKRTTMFRSAIKFKKEVAA